MLAVVYRCLANPADDRYAGGDDLPLSGWSAPTLGDLKKGPLVQFRQVCPPELVYQERLYGEYQDITLVNGHRILLYSARGATNGPTLCQFWADEIQERPYEDAWDNIQGRARWLNCQASGIAERGHVEDLFRGVDAPNRMTRLLFPEDNAINMAKGFVDEMRASMPASRLRDADGWLLPVGAMFPTFSREHNVRLPASIQRMPIASLRALPTSFAVDPGRAAAVAFAQPVDVEVERGVHGRRRERGIVFVDQLMPDHKDAEELADYIRTKCTWVKGLDAPDPKKWCIDRERSVICLDPTAEPDQVRHFQKAFRGVRVVQVQRGFYHVEENGIRAVDRAVRDQHKNARLFVHPSLASNVSKRGIVEMFSNHLASKPKD